MLLLKLSNACFIDGPENTDISHNTCEFVLQYIFKCASKAEIAEIGLATKGQLRQKDIEKLPKSVQTDIREAYAKRRTI